MVTKTFREDITEIKVSVARIEQHLKDMNGKIFAHDTFLTKDCPARHQELRDIVVRNTTIIGIIVIIMNALIMLGVNRIGG